MKIVIDIPEEMYQKIKENMVILGRRSNRTFDNILFDAVENGTPLPKEHGDLKDMDEIIEKIRKLPNAGVHWFINAESVFNTIFDAPTIIEGSDKCGNGI